MHGTVPRLLYAALVVFLASLAYGINYQYFSEHEVTNTFDRIRFWHEDTLAGPVRSNDTISIMEAPVFTDYVITGTWFFREGIQYNPHFNFIVPPVFEAPEFLLPEQAGLIRQRAMEQNFYFDFGDSMDAWARIKHDTLRVWWTEQGMPFDTLDYSDMLLPDSATVFFEASLRLSGIVSTVLTIGASGRIGLEDNIVYASSELWNPTPGHGEKFALVSENEIKVLNTPANGRENSDGMGFAQPDPDLTDIWLNGIYVALNESFTFEQQNDPDSGYVCQCMPDDRGTIYLYGSLIHQRRGYVHRSNRGSTGYGKTYRYDNAMRFWDFGLFDSTYRENAVVPPAVNFGNVLIGDIAWDTVRVYNDFVPTWLTNISSDFITPIFHDTTNWVHEIPVAFIPSAPGLRTGDLTFDIPYYDRTVTVPITGTGVTTLADDFTPHPASLSLSSYPNPFNARATLSFTLPEPSPVTLELFDVQGRLAATVANAHYPAGQHAVHVEGFSLASGVYLARLTTATRIASTKLLLLK